MRARTVFGAAVTISYCAVCAACIYYLVKHARRGNTMRVFQQMPDGTVIEREIDKPERPGI